MFVHMSVHMPYYPGVMIMKTEAIPLLVWISNNWEIIQRKVWINDQEVGEGYVLAE